MRLLYRALRLIAGRLRFRRAVSVSAESSSRLHCFRSHSKNRFKRSRFSAARLVKTRHYALSPIGSLLPLRRAVAVLFSVPVESSQSE